MRVFVCMLFGSIC